MSQRELRALLADQHKNSSTRRMRLSRDMSEKIAELEAKLKEALTTIDEQKTELERAKESDLQLQQRLDDAKAELEAVTLHAEVEKLRALEKVREDEWERSQAWADDLRERFRAKKSLEERIATLEAGTASKATTAPTGGLTDPSGPLTSDNGVVSPATTAVSTTAPSTPLTSASTSTSTTVVSTASMSTSTTPSATGTSVTGSTS